MMLFVPKDVLTSAKSKAPDKMQHYTAFYLGLHCCASIRLGVSSTQRVNAHACHVGFMEKQSKDEFSKTAKAS